MGMGWSLVAAGGAAWCGRSRWQSRPEKLARTETGKAGYKDPPSRQNTPADLISRQCIVRPPDLINRQDIVRR